MDLAPVGVPVPPELPVVVASRPRRCHGYAAAAALFQAQVIDEVPFVVMVFVVEFFDRLFLADAGNAHDLATANRLAIADVAGRGVSRFR